MNGILANFYHCLTTQPLTPSTNDLHNTLALACSRDVTVLVALLFGLTFGWLLFWQPQWLRTKDLFHYAYLARYPLIFQFLLIGLGYGSVYGAATTLRNLFMLQSWWEVAIVTWLALLAVWTPFFALRIIARAAIERFNVEFRLERPTDRLGWLFTRSGFYGLAALPLITTLYLFSEDLIRWQKLGGIGVGVALALVCGFAQRVLLDKCGPYVERKLKDTGRRINQGRQWVRSRVNHLCHWLLPLVPHRLQAGLDRLATLTAKRARGALFKGYAFELGHGSATFFFLVTLVVYILVGWYFAPDGNFPAFEPPALAYLLLLLAMLSWMFAGAAFFVDRYHLPVILLALALSLLIWQVGDSDYFYPVQERDVAKQMASAEKVTPNLALQAWHKQHDDTLPLVIVTTAGGGIKAAIWTTTVLQALQTWLGDRFAKHIVLVSSVSGGSVGALYYLDAWQADGPPTPTALENAVNSAAKPSLSGAVWGLLYPDLWRTVAPWPPGFWNGVRDRGWAMEQAWRRNLVEQRVTLDDWRDEIRAGKRPAVLFNTTTVENGSIFVLTPLDEPGAAEKQQASVWRSVYFSSRYPTHTLNVATAARLSATFPYVSPIARPIASTTPITPGYHLADGGYFDNYGVLSALEWLEAVEKEVLAQKRNVLLIQIESALVQQEFLSKANENAGWLYALAGPLVGVVNSDFTSQKWRNTQAITWLNRLYPEVTIKPVTFVYTGTASLSWQLSATEIADIRNTIYTTGTVAAARDACAFFYADEADTRTRCQIEPPPVLKK